MGKDYLAMTKGGYYNGKKDGCNYIQFIYLGHALG